LSGKVELYNIISVLKGEVAEAASELRRKSGDFSAAASPSSTGIAIKFSKKGLLAVLLCYVVLLSPNISGTLFCNSQKNLVIEKAQSNAALASF
jgi:hypothetical protein